MPLWLLVVVLAAVVIAGALTMGWLASRLPRSTKKSFAVASALFLSFGMFNPNQERIAEVREDGEHARRQKAGDPPEAVEDEEDAE